MVMAWAKIPSTWARVKIPSATLDSNDVLDEDSFTQLPGLSAIRWKTHGSAGTAAIMVLIALAIISNQRQREDGIRKDNKVQITYNDIANMTGFSRAIISKALRILRDVSAISVTREGKKCVYTLLGIESDGKWCALPQAFILDGADYLKKFKGICEIIRRPSSLFAMKLYMLLLAFRERRSNTTRISYDVITSYTGMRREDISTAWQILLAAGLGYLADDTEVPLKKGERNHNRYKIRGLNASG